MEQKKQETEPGTPVVDKKYSIVIVHDGPFLIYGNPPLQQEFIVPDKEGEAWVYKTGESYKMDTEPVALCRCGQSKNKPYCDGSHKTASWDPALTASREPLLSEAEYTEGPAVELADNPRFCVHARFCMAKGSVWELTEESEDPRAKEMAIREVFHCPSGRLKIMDKNKGEYMEPALAPSLSLIEDPQKQCSGPLWVKGGIPMEDDSHKSYETRNRVTLCRCGASGNKPFCDGTHMSVGFKDGLSAQPKH